MTSPQRVFTALSPQHEEWGEVAPAPWDLPIMGFGVADWRPGSVESVFRHRAAFSQNLQAWAEASKVELVLAAVAANDRRWQSVLPLLDFTCFDMTYAVKLPALQKAVIPETRVDVRPVTPDDMHLLEPLAEQVFKFGRYHADPHVPVELANKRYRQWLRNEFEGLGPNSLLYVIGDPGAVKGFFHVIIDGRVGHVTIFAVDQPYQKGMTAFNLLAGTFRALQALGVTQLESKISAANVGILNLIKAFGWRFAPPEAIYYWHAPNARHLLGYEEVLQIAVATPATGD